MALPMCVMDSTDNMELEESDGQSVEDHCLPHHLRIGVVIVTMIWFCPKFDHFKDFQLL